MLLTFVLMFLTSHAHAQNYASVTVIDSCALHGHVYELNRPTAFVCSGNLTIDEGTVIITHGYPLEISATWQLVMGDQNGLKIRASTKDLKPSAEILIQAATASGLVDIDNRPASDRAYGGDVELHFTTTRDFRSSSKVGHGARVKASLNGSDVSERALSSLK